MGEKKKKKQEMTSSLLPSSSSLRSSSSRKDSGSPATTTAHQGNHVKTASVGCMSGIFHIMSKYHTRRKFLTFGKKQERNAIIRAPTSPLPPDKSPPPKPENAITCKAIDHTSLAGRSSLDQAPRSPAIPADIRRSSADSSMNSPRVVARLMGLEDLPPASPVPVRAVSVSPAAEKRRKLLGALEKCDEDLQALRKIIEAVRATQTQPREVALIPPRVVEMKRREEVEEVESEVGSDEPSPVAVLDHHHLSYKRRTPNNAQIMQQQQYPKQQLKQQMTRKKPGDHEDKAISFHSKPSLAIVITTAPQALHFPASTTTHQQLLSIAATTAIAAAPWSTAMQESVIEVCRDVEWGLKQEIGRIGLLLQDFILRELIEEITKELGSCFKLYRTSSFNLPFEACKRKLSF